MTYCVQADVQAAAGGEKHLRELTDQNQDGTADAGIISRAIVAADAWINSELSKRLSVPLAEPVPQLIKDISADEAVYRLKRWRSMASQDDRDDHEERSALLRDIAKGMSTVGTDPAPAKSSLVVDRYSARSEERTISRKKLEGFS